MSLWVYVRERNGEKGRESREEEKGERGKITVKGIKNIHMQKLLIYFQAGIHKRDIRETYVTWTGSEGPTMQASTWSIRHLLWSRGKKTKVCPLVGSGIEEREKWMGLRHTYRRWRGTGIESL